MTHEKILTMAGLTEEAIQGGTLAVRTPIDGTEIAHLHEHDSADVDSALVAAKSAFVQWRNVPAPRRGELVRLIGDELRASKEALGALVSLECGKILQEGLGEEQEMIDICDFAVGQSRQLHGLTIASERPSHAMRETWHPIGVCGIVTAFNFPVAPYCWNAALALVCGDPVIWKPSEETPLTALATQEIVQRALVRFGDAPERLCQVLVGGAEVGRPLADSPDVDVVSATGSTRMGQRVDRPSLSDSADRFSNSAATMR